MESPSEPPFWDHFNPGLALLVPLWAIWPNAKLMILIQAICLASPAPIAFGIVRRSGGCSMAAAIWAAAYLAYPAVGQLNLSGSYGWHPVSLALPLIFYSIYALLKGWRSFAAGAAILACSFKETVIVSVACLAFAMVIQKWILRPSIGKRRASVTLLADRLPSFVWLAIGLTLTIVFYFIYTLAGFSHFQSSRFAHLGNSTWEIVLSPVFNPSVFWGQVFRPSSVYYLLVLSVPLGLRSVVSGWSVLIAVAFPIGVLLAWDLNLSTSISLQYVTTLIPILIFGAITGSARRVDNLAANPSAEQSSREHPILVGAATALAAGITASIFFGALPWSSPSWGQFDDRKYSSTCRIDPQRIEFLEEVVALVRDRQSRVMATGRIAAHLLTVRRLETVDSYYVRALALSLEAGPDRSAVELFDWIVLDLHEEAQQDQIKSIVVKQKAEQAGYETVRETDGIVVLRRP